MSVVASEHEVPFVDLYTPMKYLMEEPEAPKLTTNGIHLNSYGYWATARYLFDALVTSENETVREQPWRVTIDAKSGSGSAEGLSLDQVESSNEGVSFFAKEEYGPTLAPPTEGDLPPQLADLRDKLTVEKLEPGIYELAIDGVSVATATAAEWSQGVPVDSSPAHVEAEALRDAANDKNRQFVYSWKAYNQVHIVGERRNSPSGRALPGEVIEFNNITKQRDAELRDSIELKTRQWRLARVLD